MDTLNLNSDITKASTLPSWFYTSTEIFEATKEKVFTRSWQLVPVDKGLNPGEAFPFTLHRGFLSEPLVLYKNADGKLSCYSNVCTHRGNILVQQPGKYKKFICSYHGRRFNVDGMFESMPEFMEAKNFPRTCEDLHKVNCHEWNSHSFISLNPAFDFNKVIDVMNERISFMPVSQFKFAKELSREYLVNAHWALYCDNYLEGFHIPFVHADLNKALDYKNYSTQLFDYCNLQTGIADDATECFNFPKGHIDYRKKVAAYYFWLFPNMMFNFYPWGLSINIVKPISINQCKVSFLTYVYDETKFDRSAGALLDKVEREDEQVVESVQRGINSRLYTSGRFSPTREQGVHHFHLLLSKFLSQEK